MAGILLSVHMNKSDLLHPIENAFQGKPGIELADLFTAYAECRRNKRRTLNALAFEVDYERELIALHEDINTGTYQPGRSMAFVVDKPVKREIFAADFRDRVVHHLIINKLNPLFEKEFIYDSYACRLGRGTHFGIQRIDRFIRQCSLNYTTDCYVLKLDIQGFFMAIDKRILWAMLRGFIVQHYPHADRDALLSLCHKILTKNPTKNCFIKGRRLNWRDLPPDKSLFHSAPLCGLPIGNLTSQVFANVYLNAFDHFIKHDMNVRYYGRYVDDFVLVHQDLAYLKSLIPIITDFLKSSLKLTLHPKKMHLQHYTKGVNFLGVVIKPHRITSGRRIKGNFYDAIARQNHIVSKEKPSNDARAAFLCSMNSYLGLMKHYSTYRLRRRMLKKHLSIWWWNLMYLSGGARKLVPKQKTIR
jgi:RNA-directed DNA polymerase